MDNADARDLYTVLNANRSLIGGALAPAEAYWRTTYPRTAATECDPCEEIRNHGFTLRMLAYGVSVGFFLLIYLLLFAQRQLSSEFRDLLLTMTGVVGTGWASIISFYFGSSVGSRTQNATLSTIAAQAGAKPPPPDGAKS
ncbi:MAG: hypothetical protein JSS43_12215 [Proteobacteria bacterium]|nr:hypothetical protein [Pseudomonadota bacterium]